MLPAVLTLLLLAAPRPPAPQDPQAVAARAERSVIRFAELDALLLERHAMSEEGRSVLRHLLRLRTLARLAEEHGLEIPLQAVKRRWDELDRELAQAGRGGIGAMLDEGRLEPDELREYLRLSLVQETLTRRALGLSDQASVGGEQQELWLDTVLGERKAEELRPPWPAPSSPVARVGELVLTRDDFARTLRRRLAEEDVRRACFHLLLEKRVRERMPDLAPEAFERALSEELLRRREEAVADPGSEGLPYETLLAARGRTESSLARDPAVRVVVLSRLWLERAWDDAALRRAYQDERAWFDGRFGESLELHTLFLRGARFKNQLNPRTFEEAEAQLVELARGLRTRAEFEKLAARHSEDPRSRERGGALGAVTRGDERVPEELRAAAFARARSEDLDAPGRRLLGPLRTPGGVLLAWIGERRPAPAWESMRGAVRTELRRRFLDECLRESAVVTWMDEAGR